MLQPAGMAAAAGGEGGPCIEAAESGWTVLDSYGRRRIRCEACLRWRRQGYFPSSVVALVVWHESYADAPVRRRTVRLSEDPLGYSCKECRAQAVADRERIEGFLLFRLPDVAAEE